MAADAKTDKAFLDLLEQFTREGRRVAASAGTSYAPAEFANHEDGKRITKDAFKKAMDLKAKKIENHEYGPLQKRHSKLIVGE